MKKLFVLGGPMGVGKTAVSQILSQRLPQSVFLDGDWCWNCRGEVNEETKKIVVDNIVFALNNYLQSQSYQNVVFCWVLHLQSVLDELLSRLDLTNCRVVNVSLVCDRETLRARLQNDVDCGLREPNVIERSLDRLACYENLSSQKVDTTGLTPAQVAEILLEM